MSRIHERWTIDGDSRRAVGDGLAPTGRVVTAAAAIMVCDSCPSCSAENA